MAEGNVAAGNGNAVEGIGTVPENGGKKPTVRNGPDRQKDVPRILLYCGIIASVLYILTDVITAEFFYPGYSYVDQQISELSAIGAPTRPIWVGMTVLWTALVVMFGLGVWLKANKGLTLRLTAILLVSWGLVGFTWMFFPMHQRGTVEAGTDIMHIALAAVQVIGMISFISLGAAYLKGRFAIYSIGTVVAVLAFGAWTGTQASAIAAGQATPWMGIVERVTVYSPTIWVLVFASMMLKIGRLDIRELIGSGRKIGKLTIPFLLVGATLNILFPAWFSVGMPNLVLGGISVLVLVPGVVVWLWSAYLLLTRVPRHELITTGPYAVVKHPLYTGVSLLVLPWLGFLFNTWLGLPIGIILYIGCRIYAPEEERELTKRFGTAWVDYTRKVQIPWL